MLHFKLHVDVSIIRLYDRLDYKEKYVLIYTSKQMTLSKGDHSILYSHDNA